MMHAHQAMTWHGSKTGVAGTLLLACLLLAPALSRPALAQDSKSVKARADAVKSGEEAKAALEENLAAWGKILDGYNSILDGSAKNTDKAYKTLLSDLKGMDGKKDAAGKSLAKMDKQAQAFFKEWEKELAQFSSDSMRQKSADMLKSDQAKYASFVDRMKQVGELFAGVTQELNDQILFLGRNLTPDGIAMMKPDAEKLNTDVQLVLEKAKVLLEGAENVPSDEPADLPHPAATGAAAGGDAGR